MPQIKASIKSVKTDAVKRAANAAVRSQIHTAVKKAVAAAATENQDAAVRNESRLSARVQAAAKADK